MRTKRTNGSHNKIGTSETHQRNGQASSRVQSEDALRGFFQRPPAHLQESHHQPATVTKIPPTLENARSPDGTSKNIKSQSVTQKFHRDYPRDSLGQTKVSDRSHNQKHEQPKTSSSSKINPIKKIYKDEDVLNDPLQSVLNQNYISEKLTAHRQQIIDTYGSSKVPTPVIKDVYKQCKNTILSDVKETKEQSLEERNKPSEFSDKHQAKEEPSHKK